MRPSSPFRQIVTKYRRGAVLSFFLFSSSVLILFNGTPGVAKPQEIGQSIFSFFQNVVSQTTHWFSFFGTSISDLSDLRSRYDKAQEKLKKLEGNERALVLLREENQRLRQQLNFHTSIPYFNIPVEIIAKDPNRVYSSFTISKGYMDGIRKNMPVIAKQDSTIGLVGKIAEVGLSSAIVQPILDGNLYISARFENSRFEGLISGKGNNEEMLAMNYVKKRGKEEIHEGDIIVTSGENSIYPADLVIGRVKSVADRQFDMSLDIAVIPILDFSRLEYLSVLRTAP